MGAFVGCAQVDHAADAEALDRRQAVRVQLRQVARPVQDTVAGPPGSGGKSADIAEVHRARDEWCVGHAGAATRGGTG